MNLRKLLLVGSAVGLSACAGAGLRPSDSCANGPQWTCGKSGPCEALGFEGGKDNLCAVGTADQVSSYNLGIQTASTRARVEVGAVLKSNLEGFTRATQDSLAASGGEDATQKLADVAQNVVKTQLAGATIIRTHFNKETNVYFALAMVDGKTLQGAVKSQVEALGAFKTLSEAKKAEVLRRAEMVNSEAREALDKVAN